MDYPDDGVPQGLLVALPLGLAIWALGLLAAIRWVQ